MYVDKQTLQNMRRTKEATAVITNTAAAVRQGSAAPASMLRKKPEV